MQPNICNFYELINILVRKKKLLRKKIEIIIR